MGHGATFVSDDTCVLVALPSGGVAVWPGAPRAKLDRAGQKESEAKAKRAQSDRAPAGSDERKSLNREADELAAEAKDLRATAEDLKRYSGELRRAGCLDSRAGPGGGVWLTRDGRRLAEAHLSTRGNGGER